MSYRFECPECSKIFVLKKGIAGRALCKGCGKRILVSDVGEDAKKLWERFGCRIGAVTLGGRRYRTRCVRLNQELAQASMGSSIAVGDEVFAYAWLLSTDEENIEVWVDMQKIGDLPSDKMRQLLNKKNNTDSPFKLGPCAIRCTCRFTVENSSKRKLEISVLEDPEGKRQIEVPLSFVNSEREKMHGSLNQMTGVAKNVTIQQSLKYISASDERSRDIRMAARKNPAGPQYFISTQYLEPDSMYGWVASDSSFSVTMVCTDGVPKVVDVQRKPAELVLAWLFGEPPVECKPDNNQGDEKPYIFREWARSATLTLTQQGRQAPADLNGSQNSHCWTFVAGLQHWYWAKVANSINAGDALSLRGESNNPADPNAISVWTASGHKIGSIPRTLANELPRRNMHAIVVEKTATLIGSSSIATHTIKLNADGSFESSDSQAGGVKILLAVGNPEATVEHVEEYARRVFASPYQPSSM